MVCSTLQLPRKETTLGNNIKKVRTILLFVNVHFNKVCENKLECYFSVNKKALTPTYLSSFLK